MILKNYNQFLNESNNTFDFKNLFLKLTEYTVPAGYEETLIPILKKYVPDLKKDNIGNYYTEIGDSKTLFTSHLDTFSKNRKKINHIIDGNMIKTDGTSILGGDNKNGIVILLYLISKGVPGTYYFFIGEESIVNGTGCWGSTNALKQNPSYFKKFDKAIAFDRRGKGSFVKRQGGRNCASDEFADAVINSFEQYGLEFGKDNAYRTDSAIFMDVIPEITNLSSGGEYEHTYMESTDIDYVEKISIAASKINWDNLPIVRKPSSIPKVLSEEIEETEKLIEESKKTFTKVSKIMGSKGFICINSDDFQPGVIMHFDKFLEEYPVELVIKGDYIKCLNGHRKIGKFKEGNFDEFNKRQKLQIKNYSRGIWLEIAKKMNNEGILSNDILNEILESYDISYDEFKEYMKTIEESKFLQFFEDHILMDISILHQGLKKKQQEQEQVLADKEFEKLKNEEIEKIQNKTNYSLINANNTRILKYFDNLEYRFIGFDTFDIEGGNWTGHNLNNNIYDLIEKFNPDIIYDSKLGVFYKK